MSIVKQFKGNKVLSSAEFVTHFKKYDKDGNGQIEASELEPFFIDLWADLGSEGQLKCDIKELKRIVLAKYDVNNDGKISMDEMSKILPTEDNFLLNFRKDVKLTSPEFMEIWYHYDLDKSGFLEGTEIEGFIHDFLKKADRTVSPGKIQEQKEAILDSIDANKDGKISLSELSELLPNDENFFRKYENFCSLSKDEKKRLIDATFAHYDKDKNEYIEEKELMAFLKDINERDGKSSDFAELQAYKIDLMKIVDRNEDGKISKSELRMFFLNDSD